MNKVIISIIFLMFLTLTASAKVITGGVIYDYTSAQQEIKQFTPVKIPFELIQLHIYDSENLYNKTNLLKGVTELKDRKLAQFSDGSYGIIYKNTPLYVWYYNRDGFLTHNEVKTSLNFPYKTYKYSNTGKLEVMTLRVSEEETFVFNDKGKPLAHWLGANCYDENNNIIMTRKIYY